MLQEVEFCGFHSGKLSSMFLFLSSNIQTKITGGASATCSIQLLKCFMFWLFSLSCICVVGSPIAKPQAATRLL